MIERFPDWSCRQPKNSDFFIFNKLGSKGGQVINRKGNVSAVFLISYQVKMETKSHNSTIFERTEKIIRNPQFLMNSFS